MTRSARPRSDALVFFGATGDLAYKKIFPALQSMAGRGKLDFPVVGVARSGWTREQLVERARASVSENGGLVEESFARLAEQGLAVVLISHNLHDIFAVADRITVLRLGRNVGIYDRRETTQQEVVHAITAGVPTKVSGIPSAEEPA